MNKKVNGALKRKKLGKMLFTKSKKSKLYFSIGHNKRHKKERRIQEKKRKNTFVCKAMKNRKI